MIKFDKTKLTKSLASNDVLVPFLEKAFETFDDPWTFEYTAKEHDDAWHPSGHCTPTVSELYDIATGKERDPISGSLRKSFMVGHYWHQLIQHIIVHKLQFAFPTDIERKGERGWGLKYAECTMQCTGGHSEYCNAWRVVGPLPYHWATGSGDIAPLRAPKWKGVVDIKTMSSNQFKQGSIPAWAADKYKCQLNLYMDFFDEEQGMILAVNKDAPHDFKEFHYVRDQVLIDSIYNKWLFVSECLDDQERPTEKDDEEHVINI